MSNTAPSTFTDPFDDLPETSSRPASGSRARSTLTLASTAVLRRRKPRLAYAAVVVVGVFAIVVTQLLLSIGLSNGAYQIESLQNQQKDLGRSNESLSEKLDGLSSPQNLAASAESLGMVTNVNPVYLRLSDGAVLGTPKAATAATGSLTGGQSSLTPNALTAGTAAAAVPATAAAPSAPTATTPPPSVAWQGDLPSPTTH
ncbi:hypothetical protein KPL76_10490 [Subtercola sp. PAMC28395]|uniref:hypothetical protein n=1 Tax=Subtercola sp. PAMC28395 TaxID=2846775 RepID=UPI001C0B3573|nr:hypothetical protein [Subtercola sp. PAMC28395]QWT23168.1 hypothetical protein KPL76_10490 [Subtercola sp. PAMC28395]